MKKFLKQTIQKKLGDNTKEDDSETPWKKFKDISNTDRETDE